LARVRENAVPGQRLRPNRIRQRFVWPTHLQRPGGDTSYPKEAVTVFASGMVIEIFNFLEMHIYRGRKKTKKSFSSKGHAEQMAAWLQFLRGQTEHPLPYEKSRTSMLLTFAVLEAIQKGESIRVNES
jgi:hypothetical protein